MPHTFLCTMGGMPWPGEWKTCRTTLTTCTSHLLAKPSSTEQLLCSPHIAVRQNSAPTWRQHWRPLHGITSPCGLPSSGHQCFPPPRFALWSEARLQWHSWSHHGNQYYLFSQLNAFNVICAPIQPMLGACSAFASRCSSRQCAAVI